MPTFSIEISDMLNVFSFKMGIIEQKVRTLKGNFKIIVPLVN